jgi:hypothetical protein
MKFGQKPTMRDKVAVASRDKSGKAMDSKPIGKPKIKPTGSLKNPGIKAVWKF